VAKDAAQKVGIGDDPRLGNERNDKYNPCDSDAAKREKNDRWSGDVGHISGDSRTHEAPMPTAAPINPCAKLKCPLPRVTSAMMSGTSTPSDAADMPSRTCAAITK
jgi:hypothetical protein